MQDIWIESFYNEIDAEKRQAFLKEHTGDPKDELDEFREKLWIARYGKRKPKNDAFVGYLMQMKYIAEGGGMSLGAQKRKQAAEVLTGLFLGSYDNLDIEKQEMVFYEIKNAFLKLIGVSKNGRGFTSVVFGMGQLSDESVAKQIRSARSYLPRRTCFIWIRSLRYSGRLHLRPFDRNFRTGSIF